MIKIPIVRFRLWIYNLITSLCSGVIFYTVIPLPSQWTNNWTRIARWCPLIGLLIGLVLSAVNSFLDFCHLPSLTRMGIIVAVWIAITGGLHLDGAMDAADGLSVTDRDRRLSVMKDSATGAFGAMAAIVILLLKTTALFDVSLPLWLVIISATGWGRWGQLMAIACYPYLRETGKGSFHKDNLRLPQDILASFWLLLGCSSLYFLFTPLLWWQIGAISIGNIAIALLTGFYFARRFGGHTGDTYGATVEWSEALILCWLTIF